MKQRENGSGQFRFSSLFWIKTANVARIPDGNILVSDPRETQRILKKECEEDFRFQ